MISKKKIAIYSGEIPSSTFIERLILGIGKTHRVLLFGKKRSAVHYKSKSIHCYYNYNNMVHDFFVTFLRSFYLLFQYPKRYIKLFKLVRQEDTFIDAYKKWSISVPVVLHLPDVFHIQWAKDLKRWLFLQTAYGVKIIVSLRGAHINYSPIADKNLAEAYRAYFPKVNAFHAVSKAIAKEAQKYHALASTISVIYSPIPQHIFDRFQPKAKTRTETIKIISVGRFHWKKGYEYALDAVYQLKKQGLKVQYTIIASDKPSESILYQIQDLDLKAEICIKAKMNQAQLFAEMQAYDMLLLPSVEEGIANVVLEAMALGIPVVSTNCGGMAEVVFPNETGWLVPILNSKALAEAVLEVVAMPEKELQNLTQRAHDFVVENFNADVCIGKFLELYEGVSG